MPATLSAARPAAPQAPFAVRRSTRQVWVLVVGAGAVRAAGFSYPFLGYRLSDLGYTAGGISAVLALYGVGWLAGQVVWGRLSDTVGRRATLVSSMLMAAVVLPCLAGATGPIAIGVSAVLAGAVFDAPRPVVSAVVADQIDDAATRARVTGWRHFATNVGAAITGAAGGLLAGTTGLPALFWVNAVACAVFALVALRCVSPDRPPRTPSAGSRSGYRAALRDARLWLLWTASVCTLTPLAGLFSIMPLLMTDAGLPASAYGWTQVASAAAVLLLTLPLNGWLAKRACRSSMVELLAASALVLGVGIGSAGLATASWQYAAAAAAAVPGEIVAFVAATAVLDRITPPDARGLYAGIWGSTLATAIICAPVLAGWSLAHGGPQLVTLTTLACGAAGAAICVPLALLLRRS
ncbi:MFS transporter [Streptomyces sp. Ru62]|uniref:MFS transporter n=1 Tax=Streptomyces sp. Ru62 TaxID=2080745 RepID=UPI0015E3BEBB|nr:MFS transporter [Streptomyces sp. Ru62]